MSRWNDSLRVLQDQFDICVLGEEHSGKSSLILHYLHNKYIEGLDASIEDLYTKPIREGSEYFEITILDTTSLLDNYSNTRKTQIRNTATILFVYAINNHESFAALEDNFDRISSVREEMPPIVLVGTKCDMEEQRQVSFDEGYEMAQRLNAISFSECSSKMSIGITEVFQPLVNYLIESKRELALHPAKQLTQEQIQEESPQDEVQEQPIEKEEEVKKSTIIESGVPQKPTSDETSEQSNVIKSEASNNTVKPIQTASKNEVSSFKQRKVKTTASTQVETKPSSSCCIIA
ncbi:GTP-binding protein of the ras family [Scheffersomyces xylosifermentans]|uniref:GTP-binding protein of the ras family n=1 Tax=Scheffersomyces xylosifermentans TaxID=1304137 RepID=UPI00315CB25F